MSYSLDVYRGTITPQKNFIYFGAYVAMFPQLIAGPVVRYSDIARELDCRTENLNGFASGRTQAYMRTCEKGADRKHHGGGRRSPV